MANRLKMAEQEAIRALWQRGWSNRRIARELGVHRDTVGRYVRSFASTAAVANPAISTPGVAVASLASLPLASNASTANAAISTPGPAGRKSACGEHAEWIEEQLELGLSAKRIHQDLVELFGFTASYQSVKRHVRGRQKTQPLPFRRLECQPAEQAQVDFGQGAPVIGPDGRRRRPWLLRVVLSYSRKGYAEVVWRQTSEDFIRALENAFWHFGGAPRTVMIDNLRAAVARADWYDPELVPKIRAFAAHYGTVFLPTKPYTPRHKGKVEREVKYVQNNGLAGRCFTSLTDENRFLWDWEERIADHRIHGTTRRQVRALFEERERAALLPLPKERFPCFHEGQRRVHRDGHIAVAQSYYSVPPEYLGRDVWVRYDAHSLRVFNRRFEQIAMHPRVAPGRFSTLEAHIHAAKTSAVEKGVPYLLRRARQIGPSAGAWAAAVVQARGIQGIRTVVGLLSLTRQHEGQAVEHAATLALTHGALRLRTLRQLLAQPSAQRRLDFMTEHPLIRDLSDYEVHLGEICGPVFTPAKG